MVFAGTSDFAVPSLRALHDAGHDVALVITQPDRPAGRGMKLTPSPVKVASVALGLPVYQPEKIRDAEAVERIRSVAPDLLIVVAYGQIIPRSVLALPRLGAINVHASLLPRWRGAAPVARAILGGETETGISIIRMDELLDHGPILSSKSVPIRADDDAATLGARLAEIGAAELVGTLGRLDQIVPTEQDDSQATVAQKLRKQESELHWEMGAHWIDRRVRGLQPWPGATLPTKLGRVKVIRGHIENNRYVLDIVQVPGKKPAPARQVLGDV